MPPALRTQRRRRRRRRRPVHPLQRRRRQPQTPCDGGGAVSYGGASGPDLRFKVRIFPAELSAPSVREEHRVGHGSDGGGDRIQRGPVRHVGGPHGQREVQAQSAGQGGRGLGCAGRRASVEQADRGGRGRDGAGRPRQGAARLGSGRAVGAARGREARLSSTAADHLRAKGARQVSEKL